MDFEKPIGLRLPALLLAALLALTLALASRAEAYVYWTNPDLGTIGRANIDGTGADRSFITGADNPFGVAVDGAHVYWTNTSDPGFNPIDRSAIGRANLDGTGVDQAFITGVDFPTSGVAVDEAHVYWVSKFSDPDPPQPPPRTGAIGRANLDGTGVEESFITGVSFPSGAVAVDASHLYWTSYHPDTYFPDPYVSPSRIGRANLDGTGVDESFIRDGAVAGVAVDDTHVWWAYSGRFGGGIMRANLDGTGAESVIPERGYLEGFFPCGLAINDTHVSWTLDESIGRARLDGSRANHEFITGSGESCGGVAVDPLGPPPSNDFRFGKVKKNRKKGAAKLTVKIPGPGELQLAKNKKVKGKDKGADAAGKEKLPIMPRRKAKKKLAARGKVKVKAKVTYAPEGGEPNTRSKPIRLRKRA